jgi:hypothetical protein
MELFFSLFSCQSIQTIILRWKEKAIFLKLRLTTSDILNLFID